MAATLSWRFARIHRRRQWLLVGWLWRNRRRLRPGVKREVSTVMSGFIVINKPVGWTSRDAVNAVKRCVRPAKVGHAGTLDPLATGVLVVGIGSTTRLLCFAQQMAKTYLAEFQLGLRSETLDLESTPEEVGCPPLTESEVQGALPLMTGTIWQAPPEFSALKVGGKRAYELARRGKVVEMAPREVTIHELSLQEFQAPRLRLRIVCGGGTYIRSLGRDLARLLGTEAVMTKLERNCIGPFKIDSAISPENLDLSAVRSALRAPLELLPDLRQRRLTDDEVQELWAGRSIPTGHLESGTAHPGSQVAAISTRSALVSLVTERDDGRLWPAINLIDSNG